MPSRPQDDVAGQLTLLGPGKDETSKWYDLNNYDTFIAYARSDVDGVLHIEQSYDATTPHLKHEVQVHPNTGKTLTCELALRFARAEYVNGSHSQNTFDLIVSYK